jgi:hypothetical protein
MPRPNANTAVRLDPTRVRVITPRPYELIRASDSEVLASGPIDAMIRLREVLGSGIIRKRARCGVEAQGDSNDTGNHETGEH